MGCTPFDNLGYIDAIISRDVLVPDTPCDAEAKTWMEPRVEMGTQVLGKQALTGDSRHGGGNIMGYYL